MQHIFQVDSSKSSQSAIDLKTKYFFSFRSRLHSTHLVSLTIHSFLLSYFYMVSKRTSSQKQQQQNDRDDKEWRKKEERRKIMWNIIWIETSVFRIIYDINLNIFTLEALRYVDSWHHCCVCVPFSKFTIHLALFVMAPNL